MATSKKEPKQHLHAWTTFFLIIIGLLTISNSVSLSRDNYGPNGGAVLSGDFDAGCQNERPIEEKRSGLGMDGNIYEVNTENNSNKFNIKISNDDFVYIPEELIQIIGIDGSSEFEEQWLIFKYKDTNWNQIKTVYSENELHQFIGEYCKNVTNLDVYKLLNCEVENEN